MGIRKCLSVTFLEDKAAVKVLDDETNLIINSLQ